MFYRGSSAALAAEREPALTTSVVPMHHRAWGLSCWRSFPTNSQLRIRGATHERAQEFCGVMYGAAVTEF